MASDQDFVRRMLQTVLTVAAVTILVAIFWAAREALMLVYISALIAMGFSPLVHMIERPRAGGRLPAVPRWLAILVIYLTVVGIVVIIGLMVVPPLVAQSVALWDRLPDEFNRFQSFLIRYRILRDPITLAEAVRSAPEGSGANAVGTVLVAVSSVIGGVFGLITIIILSFYLLIEASAMFEYWIRFVPAARRGGGDGRPPDRRTTLRADPRDPRHPQRRHSLHRRRPDRRRPRHDATGVGPSHPAHTGLSRRNEGTRRLFCTIAVFVDFVSLS